MNRHEAATDDTCMPQETGSKRYTGRPCREGTTKNDVKITGNRKRNMVGNYYYGVV